MKVTKRTVFGKKLKASRKLGMMPAVIYDKDTNISVEMPLTDFEKMYLEKGHTGVVKVEVEGKEHNILIDHVHNHPVTRLPIHATLREVNLKEEINAVVPLHIINEELCMGVKDDGGILVQNISEVEVLALPNDIPSHIDVDVENLRLEGEGIKLEDLKLPAKVKFATEDENLLSQVVVLITQKAAEEPEPEVNAEPEAFVPAEATKEKKKDEGETESAEEK